MGRIHQICEILTLAECYARARQIAPSTLSHRAKRSSTWLERCATGNVALRSAIGFVQWLSNNWPIGLEWPAGIERPEPERGSPARAFFRPIVLRQWLSDVVRGDSAAFAGRREGARGAGHPSVRERDGRGGDAARALGTDRRARGAVRGAGVQAFRLLRRGAPVSRRSWRRSLAAVGDRQRTDADRARHLGGRSVCLTPHAANGNIPGPILPTVPRGLGRPSEGSSAVGRDRHGRRRRGARALAVHARRAAVGLAVALGVLFVAPLVPGANGTAYAQATGVTLSVSPDEVGSRRARRC